MKIFLLFVVFTSCATGKLELNQAELKPYKSASSITQVSQKFVTMSVVDVIDKTNSAQIGQAMTGSTYTKTPVFLRNNITEFSQKYFIEALKSRGIIIQQGAQLQLEITINKLWVEEVIEKFQPEKAKCVADVSFRLTGNKNIWHGQYWNEFLSPGDMADGTTRLAPTLASCLNEITEQLVKDQKFLDKLK